jgi:excisionase family DNA binding protein
MNDEILTVKEVAEMLKVKPGTVNQWMFRGIKLPFFKLGGTIRFKRSSIEAFIKEREAEALRR